MAVPAIKAVPADDIPDHLVPADDMPANLVPQSDLPDHLAPAAATAIPTMKITPPDKYAGWDTPSGPPTESVPLTDNRGKTYGSILPFARDNKTGSVELAVPEMLRAPVRGVVEGGQEARGVRPVNDPAARDDIYAAASFGAGAAPAGAVKSVTSAGADPSFRPLYELVSRVTGEDISKNPGALRVVKRLEQDQKAGGATSAQDILDLLASAPDKPLTLADVGGENNLALAGRVSRAPGMSRQTMTDALSSRDMGAGARLSEDVNQGIGSGSSYDAATTLNEVRATAAKPAYEAAYQHPPINPDEMAETGSIGVLLSRPSMRAGMANARKIAAEEGRDMNTLGIDLDEQGIPFFTKVPSWQTLDYVKRGVDNVVEQYRDKTTGRLVLDTYGRAAEETRATYRTILRNLNEPYGKALDTYSGPSTSLDALRAGQDFTRQRPEEIKRRLATLGAGDKEFYKMGAADYLRTALAKKGPSADEAKAIIGSQYMRDQLRPLFDSQSDYDRFIKSVEAEGRMFSTGSNILGNSKTAARMAEDTGPAWEAISHGAHGLSHAAANNWLSAATSMIRSFTSAMGTRDPAINAEIARFETVDLSGKDVAGRLEELRKFLATMPKTRSQTSAYAPPVMRLTAPGTMGLAMDPQGQARRNMGTQGPLEIFPQ